jgi:murein DD-endopeptidase MepM/ murein hydrolase activator NlpD
MGSLDDISPELPRSRPARRSWLASRRARFVVGGLAIADVAILAIVALLATQTLLPPASAIRSSNDPSATPSTMIAAVATMTAIPISTAGPTPTPTPGSSGLTPASMLTGYVWPMANAVITLPFGPSKYGEFLVNGVLFHDGVDMALPTPGSCNANVVAAHDGIVLTAGRDYADFMGWQGDLTAYKKKFAPASWKASLPVVIVIDDGDGYRSIYAHEWANVKVKAGQHVKAGQLIGYEGATGNVTGCHLHFGLYSPLETATFANLPQYMKDYHLPAAETARIDPLLVLPYRNDVSEMRALRPADAAAWDAAHPSSAPTSKPTSSPTR